MQLFQILSKTTWYILPTTKYKEILKLVIVYKYLAPILIFLKSFMELKYILYSAVIYSTEYLIENEINNDKIISCIIVIWLF